MGLSGSGKSTIAARVHQELMRRGTEVEYIDGDALREVFPDTGFTWTEREEHLRRTGYLVSRLAAHGVTVVVALGSPYRESRDFMRKLCCEFVEIYAAGRVRAAHPKGLYARVRRGEIRNFTGIDDPYEPHEHPELTLDARVLSVDQCVARVLAWFGGQL